MIYRRFGYCLPRAKIDKNDNFDAPKGLGGLRSLQDAAGSLEDAAEIFRKPPGSASKKVILVSLQKKSGNARFCFTWRRF